MSANEGVERLDKWVACNKNNSIDGPTFTVDAKGDTQKTICRAKYTML